MAQCRPSAGALGSEQRIPGCSSCIVCYPGRACRRLRRTSRARPSRCRARAWWIASQIRTRSLIEDIPYCPRRSVAAAVFGALVRIGAAHRAIPGITKRLPATLSLSRIQVSFGGVQITASDGVFARDRSFGQQGSWQCYNLRALTRGTACPTSK